MIPYLIDDHLSILLPPALPSHVLHQAGQGGVGPRGDSQGGGGRQEPLLAHNPCTGPVMSIKQGSNGLEESVKRHKEEKMLLSDIKSK